MPFSAGPAPVRNNNIEASVIAAFATVVVHSLAWVIDEAVATRRRSAGTLGGGMPALPSITTMMKVVECVCPTAAVANQLPGGSAEDPHP